MDRGLMDLDGPVFSVMDKVGRMAVLSILWIVGCLPLVTVATSTTALYYAISKSIRRDCGSATQEFWASYKANLRRGVPITLVFSALGAVLSYNIWLLSQEGQGNNLLLWGSVILLFVLLACSVYICPVLSRFSIAAGKACRLAFVMAVRFLPYTLLILVCAITVGYLQVFVLPMPLLVLLPSAMCYGATYPIEKALLAYMPKKEENDDSWYYQ